MTLETLAAVEVNSVVLFTPRCGAAESQAILRRKRFNGLPRSR